MRSRTSISAPDGGPARGRGWARTPRRAAATAAPRPRPRAPRPPAIPPPPYSPSISATTSASLRRAPPLDLLADRRPPAPGPNGSKSMIKELVAVDLAVVVQVRRRDPSARRAPRCDVIPEPLRRFRHVLEDDEPFRSASNASNPSSRAASLVTSRTRFVTVPTTRQVRPAAVLVHRREHRLQLARVGLEPERTSRELQLVLVDVPAVIRVHEPKRLDELRHELGTQTARVERLRRPSPWSRERLATRRDSNRRPNESRRAALRRTLRPPPPSPPSPRVPRSFPSSSPCA